MANTFPYLALYPHGDTQAFVFVVPYYYISDISDSFHPHIISGKVLHNIGRMICDSHHNFATIQGNDCVTDCLLFCTLWEGLCTNIFSISDFVCISEFVIRNNNSDNSPTSSDDEIPGVSPLSSYRFNTLAHDHGVHDFFIRVFHQKHFIQPIQVKLKIC